MERDSARSCVWERALSLCRASDIWRVLGGVTPPCLFPVVGAVLGQDRHPIALPDAQPLFQEGRAAIGPLV